MGYKFDDLYPSKFLKASDFSAPEILVIESVSIEEVGQRQDKKPVLYFKDEGKGLILNKTCATQIGEITGSDDTDAWRGAKVEIYVDNNVMFQGKRTPGLRIRAPQQRPASRGNGAPERHPEPPQQMAPPDAVTDDIPDPGDPVPARQRRQAADKPPF